MLFHFCPQIFYRNEVRALWWPLQTSTLLSLSHFATSLEVCLGSLSIWKTHLWPSFNFLTDVWDVATIYPHTFPPHDAIYFVKCTSPSCSKAPPQHDAASRLGWCSSACKPPPVLPNITMVIMAKQFYFCFIRSEDISFVPVSSSIFTGLLLFWDCFALFKPKYVNL